MCIHAHMWVYMCVCIFACMFTRTVMWLYVCVCRHMYVYTRIHVFMTVYVSVCSHMYVHTCVYIYMSVCVCGTLFFSPSAIRSSLTSAILERRRERERLMVYFRLVNMLGILRLDFRYKYVFFSPYFLFITDWGWCIYNFFICI